MFSIRSTDSHTTTKGAGQTHRMSTIDNGCGRLDDASGCSMAPDEGTDLRLQTVTSAQGRRGLRGRMRSQPAV
jgi:hypothetical protein